MPPPRPESLHDSTARGQHSLAAPTREVYVIADALGVAGNRATLNGRSKGREFPAFVFNDPDFNLPLTNARCLHDSLRLYDAEAVQHNLCCSAASVPFKRVSQRGITSYSIAPPLSDLVDGSQCGQLTVGRHATERVQLADKAQGNRVVDEVIATDTAAMQGQQVTVKAADNGHQIAGILYGIPCRSGPHLDGISTIGDSISIRHGLLLGLGVSNSKEQAGIQ